MQDSRRDIVVGFVGREEEKEGKKGHPAEMFQQQLCAVGGEKKKKNEINQDIQFRAFLVLFQWGTDCFYICSPLRLLCLSPQN